MGSNYWCRSDSFLYCLFSRVHGWQQLCDSVRPRHRESLHLPLHHIWCHLHGVLCPPDWKVVQHAGNFYLYKHNTFKGSSPNISRLTVMVTWSITDTAVMTAMVVKLDGTNSEEIVTNTQKISSIHGQRQEIFALIMVVTLHPYLMKKRMIFFCH